MKQPLNSKPSSIKAFLKRQQISSKTKHYLDLPTNRTSKQQAKETKLILSEDERKKWSDKLQSLQVQKKALDSIELEEENCVWSRIINGLPAGQLSFILRACSDTLPTPLNLGRWKIRLQANCPLCQSQEATVRHILNGCPTALKEGRYTWRHDRIFLHLTQSLQGTIVDGGIFADLDHFRAAESPPTTLPERNIVTTARPDLVILKENTIRMIELTICTDSKEGMEAARKRKSPS